MRMPTIAWFKDSVYRVIATYIESVLGLIIASNIASLNYSSIKTFAIAAIPAALATVKTLIASQVGDPNTGSFMSSSINQNGQTT